MNPPLNPPIFPPMPLDVTPFAALRLSLAPPAATGPRAPIDMVRDALLLLILQQLDRLLATLERLFTTWQAGILPPPAPPRPHAAPSRRSAPVPTSTSRPSSPPRLTAPIAAPGSPPRSPTPPHGRRRTTRRTRLRAIIQPRAAASPPLPHIPPPARTSAPTSQALFALIARHLDTCLICCSFGLLRHGTRRSRAARHPGYWA